MAATFSNLLAGGIDRLVRWVVVPVTGIIPVLVRTGLLFLAFAALWLAVLVALVADPGRLAAAWQAIAGLPVPVQAAAWLLFLPPMAALWAWSTDWPLAIRVAVVLGLAGWNLLVFLPRRDAASPARAS